MIAAPRVIAEYTRAHARGQGSTVVGIAGAVAAGKTRLATDVARAVADAGSTVEVVSTDGFLFPNAVLAQRDLFMRKGFPESYDVAALRAFVGALRAGAADVVVPVYSHETYDIVPDEHRTIAPVDVVVIEGVNALSALSDRLDVGVYVHAEEADLERWYMARFHELCKTDDPASFYYRFVDMSSDDVDALALQAWRGINLVNLREHIEPSRASARLVVRKGADHMVIAVDVRDDGATFDRRS